MKGLFYFLLVWIPFGQGGYQTRYSGLDEQLLETESAALRPGSEVLPDEINPRGCPKCVNRDIIEKITRLNVKGEILRKLGLKTAPIVNRTSLDFPNHIITKLIKEAEKREFQFDDEVMSDQPYGFHDSYEGDETFYDEEDEEDDEDLLLTEQITIPSKNGEGFVPDKILELKNIQYFPLSSSQIQPHVWRNIAKATLYIFVPISTSTDERQAWIDFHYASLDKNGNPSLTLETMKKVVLKENRASWIQLDVTRVVNMWLNNVTSNLGYKYSVVTKSGTKLDLSAYINSHAPHLILDVQENRMGYSMRKGQAKVCTDPENHGEGRCCMWPLTINFFDDFGWDFVIHPRKFDVNFCIGNCKLGETITSSLHAHVLQLAQITPCCTSQKLYTVNLLYIDDEMKIVLGKLPKMKVAKCGCS